MTPPSPDINPEGRVMVDCHKILGQAHSFVGKLEELGALSKKNADQWRKDSDELKDRMKEHITSEPPLTEGSEDTRPRLFSRCVEIIDQKIKELKSAWAKIQNKEESR